MPDDILLSEMRHLSKSKLIAYRQCPKRLWLEVHRPELREDSSGTQVGYQMGEIARRIYDPEGQGTVIDVETEGFDGAFARSAELLGTSQKPVFEAGPSSRSGTSAPGTPQTGSPRRAP